MVRLNAVMCSLTTGISEIIEREASFKQTMIEEFFISFLSEDGVNERRPPLVDDDLRMGITARHAIFSWLGGAMLFRETLQLGCMM